MKKSFSLNLLKSVYGVANIILTGILAFVFTGYPTAADTGVEALVMYDHTLIATIGAIAVASLWYGYVNLYILTNVQEKVDGLYDLVTTEAGGEKVKLFD